MRVPVGRSDAEFADAVFRGHAVQLWVAEWIRRQTGFLVYTPPARIRPRFQDRHRFTDRYDILVARPGSGLIQVEVKGRNEAWTGPDGPFRSCKALPGMFLVEKADAYREGSVYIVVAKKSRHLAVVNPSMQEFFEVAQQDNRFANQPPSDHLFIDPQLIPFYHEDGSLTHEPRK